MLVMFLDLEHWFSNNFGIWPSPNNSYRFASNGILVMSLHGQAHAAPRRPQSNVDTVRSADLYPGALRANHEWRPVWIGLGGAGPLGL